MSRILVVEKDEILRISHHKLLADDGFEVVSAKSGDEGMQLCYNLEVDLVICDCSATSLNAPLIERLHLVFPKLPILALSGAQEAAVRERALNHGASAFLQRPCSHAHLSSTADRLLHMNNESAEEIDELRLFDSL